MRIIAGEYKGRNIKVPKSKLVRPTTDKNKESIFNYLNNHIDFSGITACDIYAGSGALGLETLSRGADEVHFVEQNYNIYKNLLGNISLLKAEDRTKVFKMTAVKFSTIKNDVKYNLVLADPPFFKDDIYKVFDNIKTSNILADDGILIIERSIQTEKEDVENFNMVPIKRLGDSLIYQYVNS